MPPSFAKNWSTLKRGRTNCGGLYPVETINWVSFGSVPRSQEVASRRDFEVRAVRKIFRTLWGTYAVLCRMDRLSPRRVGVLSNCQRPPRDQHSKRRHEQVWQAHSGPRARSVCLQFNRSRYQPKLPKRDIRCGCIGSSIGFKITELR